MNFFKKSTPAPVVVQSTTKGKDKAVEVPPPPYSTTTVQPSRKQISPADRIAEEISDILRIDPVRPRAFSVKRRPTTHSLESITVYRSRRELKTVLEMALAQLGSNRTRNSRTFRADDLFYVRNDLRNVLEVSRRFTLEEQRRGQAGTAEDDEGEEEESEESAFSAELKMNSRSRGYNILSSIAGMQIAHPDDVIEVINFLDQEFLDWLREGHAALVDEGMTFAILGDLFQPGSLCVGRCRDTGPAALGYRVLWSGYRMTTTLAGQFRWFELDLQFVVSSGSEFHTCTWKESISDFSGVKKFRGGDLSVSPMTPDMHDRLSARGRMYAELARGHHYMAYQSEGFSVHMRSSSGAAVSSINSAHQRAAQVSFLRSNGRVMLDTAVGMALGHFAAESHGFGPSASMVTALTTASQQHMQAQLYGAMQGGMRQQVDSLGYQAHTFPTLPDALAPLCWPAVAGFSFTAKVWGHVLLDSVSPIKFEANAFESLVLEPERKTLIKAIVQHSGAAADAGILNQSGSVFLLHGTPGVGKTLTAQAVAELLQRPLYSVSMGELGTSPEQVEVRLKEIFELSTVWNCLVLLDEADIFLEARGKAEIQRNAIIGIFLRALETYQGVLFLTSNRSVGIDPAFHSRLTLTIKYDALDQPKRANVWRVLGASWGIEMKDAELLSQAPLNGRQIKSALRLATALAEAASEGVQLHHLQKAVGLCMNFQSDMAALEEEELKKSLK